MNRVSLAYYVGLAIINVIGTILNSLLVYMFYTKRRQLLHDNLNNLILLAMSIANLLVGVTGTINWILIANGISLGIYKIVGIIPMFSSMFATVIILSILTFNQLIAVMFPLRYNALMTARRVGVAIFSAFFFAGLFAVSDMLLYNFSTNAIEIRVRAVFMTVVFVLGVSVLAVSNYKLFCSIQHQRKRLVPLSTVSSAVSYNRPSTIDVTQVVVMKKNANLMRQKTRFKRGTTCIYMVAIHIFTWLPITSYYFSGLCGRNSAIVPLRRICITIATFNSILNPCLYLLLKKNFRRSLREIFGIAPAVHFE